MYFIVMNISYMYNFCISYQPYVGNSHSARVDGCDDTSIVITFII